MVKKVSFKEGTKARKKREEIVKALKREKQPKKLRKNGAPTKKGARFAIATATVKKSRKKKRKSNPKGFIKRKFM